MSELMHSSIPYGITAPTTSAPTPLSFARLRLASDSKQTSSLQRIQIWPYPIVEDVRSINDVTICILIPLFDDIVCTGVKKFSKIIIFFLKNKHLFNVLKSKNLFFSCNL